MKKIVFVFVMLIGCFVTQRAQTPEVVTVLQGFDPVELT